MIQSKTTPRFEENGWAGAFTANLTKKQQAILNSQGRSQANFSRRSLSVGEGAAVKVRGRTFSNGSIGSNRGSSSIDLAKVKIDLKAQPKQRQHNFQTFDPKEAITLGPRPQSLKGFFKKIVDSCLFNRPGSTGNEKLSFSRSEDSDTESTGSISSSSSTTQNSAGSEEKGSYFQSDASNHFDDLELKYSTSEEGPFSSARYPNPDYISPASSYEDNA